MANRKTAKRTIKRVSKKPKLVWLRIHKFRHVEPCELRFNDGFNVLLGLNATGKTTLLELTAAALGSNFARVKREEFHIEYELALPNGKILVYVRNDKLKAPPATLHRWPLASGLSASARSRLNDRSSMEVSYEPSVEVKISTEALGEYIFRAHGRGVEAEHGGKKICHDQDVKSLLSSGNVLGVFFPVLLELENHQELVSLLMSMFYWENVRRFDESLGFLRYITGAKRSVSVFKPRTLSSDVNAFGDEAFPPSLIREIERQARQWQGPGVVPGLSISAEQVELMAKIAAMLGFESVKLQVTHLGTDVVGSLDEIRFGSLRFMLQRNDGSIISHKLLSYGQKRALAFLYYLEANPDIVIADELVDGLHHSWIVDCIEAIGDRQVFLASQNPLLLDYLEFDSAEKVGKSFIQCRIKPDKAGDRMSWANLSEYDAARFFEAYQVGLQHVSEILRSKGLW